MIALVFFVVGGVASWLLWRGLEPTWRSSVVLRRENYRGHHLTVASGVAIVLASVLVGATYELTVRAGGRSPAELARGATMPLVAVLGFGLIGLLDDLLDDGTNAVGAKGFRGHLAALRRVTITTGMVKLVAGVALALLVVDGDLSDSVRGGVLVAGAANVANLFDRAPGRTIKVSLSGAVLVAALGAPGWHLAGVMLVLGAGAGLLVPDLRERCMLGDTGSNVLGAAVGLGLVESLGTSGEWIAAAFVVMLNVASEVISFSRVIDAVAPLRWLDRLGSLPERRSAASRPAPE